MGDITFFSIPKPFKKENEVFQTNAIESWKALRPAPRIVLFGNDPSVRTAADALGVSFSPISKQTSYGTPLIDEPFEIAESRFGSPKLAYLNCDIVLFPGFIEAIERVRFKRFLVVGQRWDLDLRDRINFRDPRWAERLLEKVRKDGSLHPPTGMDYFVFSRGVWRKKIPGFAVGRTLWDNYLVFLARKLRLKVIDATSAILAVHQNHGYFHIPDRKGSDWDSPEVEMNQRLMEENGATPFDTGDATWVLSEKDLRRALDISHIRRRINRAPLLHPRTRMASASILLIGRKMRKLMRNG